MSRLITWFTPGWSALDPATQRDTLAAAQQDAKASGRMLWLLPMAMGPVLVAVLLLSRLWPASVWLAAPLALVAAQVAHHVNRVWALRERVAQQLALQTVQRLAAQALARPQGG